MAKHIRVEPDCPDCGTEMTRVSRSHGPYTNNKPWGSSFEAWYRCGKCDFETEHATAKHMDDAKKKAEELALKYMPK